MFDQGFPGNPDQGPPWSVGKKKNPGPGPGTPKIPFSNIFCINVFSIFVQKTILVVNDCFLFNKQQCTVFLYLINN